MRIFLLLFLFIFAACDEAPVEEVEQEVTPPSLVLNEASFSDLSGWANDSLETAGDAFAKTCARVAKKPPEAKLGPLEQAGQAGDWQNVCQHFIALETRTPENLHAFFERHFDVWQASADEETEGLFTGYYEATLKGSLTRTERYNIPLHVRPDDLVMVQLGEFRDDLKGRRIAGRVHDGKLKPYESREEIVNGDWPHNDKVLIWVDDAVDAFFVQIQGSGIVELEDGSTMRIGYAGQNGHVYYAIGRELIKLGALTKENVSLQTIRAWLAANPDKADEIMNTNASYVFFEEIKGEGPKGGSGVALTAGRSLAIDHSLISYGIPVWLDAQHPTDPSQPNLQRLMIAQDTGGAIRGPVRGDVFWGYGEQAEIVAGQMKSPGRYWFLLPKTQ